MELVGRLNLMTLRPVGNRFNEDTWTEYCLGIKVVVYKPGVD